MFVDRRDTYRECFLIFFLVPYSTEFVNKSSKKEQLVLETKGRL